METAYTTTLLQEYWWLLISVLGAVLVFLLFVQGGQTMLLCTRRAEERNLMVNAIGTKWELTFTTLVVFGGAFFASFPLFYSTSFGGAYWLWVLILMSFVAQAVGYQYRRKRGNPYGTRFFDVLLVLSGAVGCLLLGVAVSMMFFGADFRVGMGNLLDPGSPVISQWGPGHGWEAMADWRNWVLGLTVLFLARTQCALYFMNSVEGGPEFHRLCRRRVRVSGALFVVCFLGFMALLLTHTGLRATGLHSFVAEPCLYLHNYLTMWWCLALLLAGVAMVLYGVGRSALAARYTKGVWWTGSGTVLVVLTLFWVAGYNATPYYPSLADPGSSLTIANSSSSPFTLSVMSVVSVLVPFVVAYIAYVWRKMNARPLTPAELDADHHSY